MSIHFLAILLLILISCSAFFSASETSLMSLNRYRLRHKAQEKNQAAQRIMSLLKRPDRLIGVILIGNTFANILASAAATLVAAHFFGDTGALLATIITTLIILIFAEIMPKTLAALHPEAVAYPASVILQFLLKLLYPLVWLSGGISNTVLRLFGVHVHERRSEPLSVEELRTVIAQASLNKPSGYQQLLLSILELDQLKVSDLMVPRQEIYGIDIELDWDIVMERLKICRFTQLLLYRENLDRIVGIVTLKEALSLLLNGRLTKRKLMSMAEEPCFIPEGTGLNRQFLNFQKEHISMGLVVDEYGDIQGIITMKDILAEIVGGVIQDLPESQSPIQVAGDGYIVDGGLTVREFNRSTGLALPAFDAKTLSGLVIEQLQAIPQGPVGIKIGNYRLIVESLEGKTIHRLRIAKLKGE